MTSEIKLHEVSTIHSTLFQTLTIDDEAGVDDEVIEIPKKILVQKTQLELTI
jgi:hypothetical protein